MGRKHGELIWIQHKSGIWDMGGPNYIHTCTERTLKLKLGYILLGLGLVFTEICFLSVQRKEGTHTVAVARWVFCGVVCKLSLSCPVEFLQGEKQAGQGIRVT